MRAFNLRFEVAAVATVAVATVAASCVLRPGQARRKELQRLEESP